MAKTTGAVSRLITRPLVHLLRFACGVCLLFGVLVLVFAAFVSLRISDAPFEMPSLGAMIERKFNDASPDTNVSVGTVSISGNGDNILANPTITLDEVTLTDQLGDPVMSADHIELGLSGKSAIQGKLLPESLNVSGIDVQLIRNPDGVFNIKVGGGTDTPAIQSIEEFFNYINEIEQLSEAKEITLRGTQIVVDDQMLSKTHVFQNAEVDIKRMGDTFEMAARLTLNVAGGQTAAVRTTLVHQLGQGRDVLDVRFENLSTSDVASRIKAFDWLRTIEASVDGAFSTVLENSQTIGDFSGVLTLRDGQIRARPAQAALPFEQIKGYFDYKKAANKFNFTSLSVASPALSASAEGIAELVRGPSGLVDMIDASMIVSDLKFAHAETFAGLMTFSDGLFEGQFDIPNNKITVDDLSIGDAPYRYSVSGFSAPSKDGWDHKYAAVVEQIDIDRLMALWPIGLIDKTRNWLINNISKGHAQNVKAVYEVIDGKPDFRLNFDARDVTTTFLRTVPALQNARGRGQISNQKLDVWLDSGFVQAGKTGRLNLAGSQFTIPNITKRPAIADIKLKTAGSLAASLHILNVERFRFLTKANLPTALGSGAVNTNGRFTFALSKKTTLRDVDLAVDATIRDFSSKRLVAGRSLRAKKLTAKVNTKRVTVSGPIAVDGIATTASWLMNFKNAGRSSITAKVPLSTTSMAKFGVRLPKGLTKGTATGDLTLQLARGQSPKYKLSSNLVGLSMSVPALNWRKSTKSKAKFAVSGRLGKVASVDAISLSGSGLTASGSLALSSNGKLKSAKMPTFKVGKWLSTSATITPSGNSAKISLRGGKADLRRLNLGGASGGGGNAISIRGLRLQVTDTIALHGVTADLATRGGTKGAFSGKINNATPIRGKLTSAKNGTRIDVTAKDAGSVLRAANLFKSYRGGALTFSMIPTTKTGIYASNFDIKGGRLRQNNVVAELLNAMSVVGLLQQLGGSGIYFERVKGGLEIRPKGVVLKKVSAVGPSMGLTANGWYDSNRKTLDLEGVVTPIYLLNGVFERVFGKLFGRQKGEGLFSFIYTMKGSVAKPRVAVNPFSILTPGVFRRIFDQKVPIPAK